MGTKEYCKDLQEGSTMGEGYDKNSHYCLLTGKKCVGTNDWTIIGDKLNPDIIERCPGNPSTKTIEDSVKDKA